SGAGWPVCISRFRFLYRKVDLSVAFARLACGGMRIWPSALLGLSLVLWLSATAWSEPVAVRFPEGVTRAFPAVRSLEGKTLAFGDFVQIAREDRVQSRLLFRFKDGSIHDETVVYSQRGVFRMEGYRLIQRGPSCR